MDKQDGDLSHFLCMYHIPFLSDRLYAKDDRTLAVTCSQGLKFKCSVFPQCVLPTAGSKYGSK